MSDEPETSRSSQSLHERFCMSEQPKRANPQNSIEFWGFATDINVKMIPNAKAQAGMTTITGYAASKFSVPEFTILSHKEKHVLISLIFNYL